MRLRASLLSIALLVLAACGSEPSKCLESRTPTPLDASTTGTITGTVTHDGAVPAAKPVSMTGDCSAVHRGPPPVAGDLLVQDGKVANAIVWITQGLGDRVFPVPTAPVTIDQAGCEYRPHVAAAQTCQPVEFVNSDPLLHNVHGTPRLSSPWNFSMGVQGSKRTLRPDRQEVAIEVRCDVHPWMRSYLGVVDHPYFAVTGSDGRFGLRDVPPGDYVVTSWHERLGTREARVTVEPRGTADVAIAYPAAGQDRGRGAPDSRN